MRCSFFAAVSGLSTPKSARNRLTKKPASTITAVMIGDTCPSKSPRRGWKEKPLVSAVPESVREGLLPGADDGPIIANPSYSFKLPGQSSGPDGGVALIYSDIVDIRIFAPLSQLSQQKGCYFTSSGDVTAPLSDRRVMKRRQERTNTQSRAVGERLHLRSEDRRDTAQLRDGAAGCAAGGAGKSCRRRTMASRTQAAALIRASARNAPVMPRQS